MSTIVPKTQTLIIIVPKKPNSDHHFSLWLITVHNCSQRRNTDCHCYNWPITDHDCSQRPNADHPRTHRLIPDHACSQKPNSDHHYSLWLITDHDCPQRLSTFVPSDQTLFTPSPPKQPVTDHCFPNNQSQLLLIFLIVGYIYNNKSEFFPV